MITTISKNVLALLVITLVFFFTLTIFFRNDDFYKNSIKINSFVLPIFYTTVVFYTNYKLLEVGNYSLKKGFIISLVSLFSAGFLSHGFIFYYLANIDLSTEMILRNQWILLNKQNAIASNPPNIKEIVKALDSPEMKNTSVVNSSNFFKFMLMQSLFYTFVSFFVSFFIRSRA